MNLFFPNFTSHTRALFALALSGFLLASCGKGEGGGEAPTGDPAIGFRGSVASATGDWLEAAASRATGVYPTGGKFGVLAYNTAADTWSVGGPTALPQVMYNQMVEKTATGATYTPVRYWVPTQKYSFFAYSPHNASGVTLSGQTTPGNPWLDFQAAAIPANQIDLATASALDRTESASPVNMAFAHALARVRFTAKVTADSSQYTSEVLKVEILGLHDQGRHDLYSKAWSSVSGNATYTPVPEKSVGSGIPIPYSTTAPQVALGSSLYVVPQTYTGDLVIKYVIYSPFNTAPIVCNETFPIANAIFTAGSSSNYLFTIKLTELHFADVTYTLKVEDWIDITDPKGNTALQ